MLIANQQVGKQELTLSLEDSSSTIELVLNEQLAETLHSDEEVSEPAARDAEALLESSAILSKSPVGMSVESTADSQNDETKATKASLASSTRNETAPQEHAKSRATFFGAEAYGDRFVFVIDSSKSMRGFRWESLCVELVRALRSLSPDQEFFVISFDATAHPMLGLVPPKDLFLKPTTRNVRRVQNWLRSIQHGYETHPSSAMAIALQLRPDAIFLLSDGEIRDDTVNRLHNWNKVDASDETSNVAIPVHTVLLESEVGYATLEQIAAENQGTFTPVMRRH